MKPARQPSDGAASAGNDAGSAFWSTDFGPIGTVQSSFDLTAAWLTDYAGWTCPVGWSAGPSSPIGLAPPSAEGGEGAAAAVPAGRLPAPAPVAVGTLFTKPLVDSLPPVASATTAAAALHASQLSSTYGVDGTGIRIGVLSDSFNALGGYASDIARGALPANVTVLQDDPFAGGTDEGRAMLQLVHDIAPGAQLYFATADGGTDAAMAANIQALRNAGCNIIVDDVTYFDEPMFQEGVISQAIDNVVASGAMYFTSAGNDASNAYEETWSTATSTPLNVTIGAGSDITFDLQWNQPLQNVSTSLGLEFKDLAGDDITASEEQGVDFNGNPITLLELQNQNFSAVDGTLTISNLGGPNPYLVKIVAMGDGQPVSISGSGVNLSNGTVIGHHEDINAITVAAAGASTPTTPEFFTSSGSGSELLFDASGNALATAVTPAKVDLTSLDGITTTVPGGLSNFYGTSAAAPTAAAVAALLMQAAPGDSNTQIENALKTTATGIGASALTGAGLINATSAAAAIATPHVYVANNNGDVIYPGTGTNTVTGGAGGDAIFITKNSSNTIDGGGGDNALDYSLAPGSVTVNFATDAVSHSFGGSDSFTNIQAITGSPFSDTFIGGAGNHVIDGVSGADTLDYSSAPGAADVNLYYHIVRNGFGGIDTVSNIPIVKGSAAGGTLIGGLAAATYIVEGGTNSITGTVGTITAEFTGLKSNYQITRPGGNNATVTALTGPATTANLTNVQYMEFADTGPITTAPTPPVTSAVMAMEAVRNGQMVSVPGLFNISDGDGDSITQYQVYLASSTGGAPFGTISQGGAPLLTQQADPLSSLSGLLYTGGLAAGTDNLWIHAFDGTQWSNWSLVQLKDLGDPPPVTRSLVSSATVDPSQAVALSQLFSASDPDGDTIAQYQVYLADAATGSQPSGALSQNGNAIASQQIVTSLNGLIYTGSAAAGSDVLWMRANDGTSWGNWTLVQMNDPGNAPPVMRSLVGSDTVSSGATVALSQLFSASDPDGDTIAQYQVYLADAGTGGPPSGSLSQNGNAIASQQIVTSLNGLIYTGSAAAGSDVLWMRARDGTSWGNWTLVQINDPGNLPPVTRSLMSSDTINSGQTAALSQLFSMSDPDGDAIAQYQIYLADASTGGQPSGSLSQGGTLIASQHAVNLTSLNGLTYTGGSTTRTDALWMRANDGTSWGNWAIVQMNDTGLSIQSSVAKLVQSLAPYSTASAPLASSALLPIDQPSILLGVQQHH